MGDRMEGIKYIDQSGKVKVLKNPVVKKKIESKFPLVYTDFGVYLLLPVLMCTGLGYWIDSFTGKESTFTLIGIVLGGITAIINLYLLLKKDDGSSRTAR